MFPSPAWRPGLLTFPSWRLGLLPFHLRSEGRGYNVPFLSLKAGVITCHFPAWRPGLLTFPSSSWRPGLLPFYLCSEGRIYWHFHPLAWRPGLFSYASALGWILFSITPCFSMGIGCNEEKRALAQLSKSVLCHKFIIFLLKGLLLVMLLLFFDIGSDFIQLRFTNRNCEVFIGPFKFRG